MCSPTLSWVCAAWLSPVMLPFYFCASGLIWPDSLDLQWHHSSGCWNFNVTHFLTNPSCSTLFVWFSKILVLYFTPTPGQCISMFETSSRIILLVFQVRIGFNSIPLELWQACWSMWVYFTCRKIQCEDGCCHQETHIWNITVSEVSLKM